MKLRTTLTCPVHQMTFAGGAQMNSTKINTLVVGYIVVGPQPISRMVGIHLEESSLPSEPRFTMSMQRARFAKQILLPSTFGIAHQFARCLSTIGNRLKHNIGEHRSKIQPFPITGSGSLTVTATCLMHTSPITPQRLSTSR